MQQFMARQTAPARPPGNLGTSGIFAVANLSPSLNPTNIDGSAMPWSSVLTGMAKPDRVRGLVIDALEAIRTQGLAAQHACRQIHGDQTLGEAERHRRAAKTSAEIILPAQPHIEKALAANGKSVEELEKITAGPSIDVSDVQQIEIRSKLAGLTPDKRVAAIFRSIEKGSDLTAAVVLGSDRFLVDFLSDSQLDAIRETWARLRHLDECRLLAQRKSDLNYLERASAVMKSWQRGTYNTAVAATGIQAAGAVRGAPGSTPVDRSRARPLPIYGRG